MNSQRIRKTSTLVIGAGVFGLLLLVLYSAVFNGPPDSTVTVARITPEFANSRETCSWKIHVPKGVRAELVLMEDLSDENSGLRLKDYWLQGLVPGVDVELTFAMERENGTSYVKFTDSPKEPLQPSTTRFKVSENAIMQMPDANSASVHEVLDPHRLIQLTGSEGEPMLSFWIRMAEAEESIEK